MAYPRPFLGSSGNRFTGILDTTINEEPRPFINLDAGPMETESAAKKSLYDALMEIANQDPQRQALIKELANAPSREDYKPTWKDRLLGGAVGALTGYSEGPSRGFNAARELVNRPYNRATEDYEERIKRLGVGANLESSDIQQKLRAFEANETNIDRDADREFREKQYEQQGWTISTNDLTGNREAVHRDGRVKILGKASQSQAEKDAAEAEKARIAREHDLAKIKATGDERLEQIAAAAKAKIASSSEALRRKAAQFKPNEVDAIANSLLAAYVEKNQIDNLGKYITESEVDGKYQVLPDKTVASGWGPFETPADNANDIKIKNELRQMIEGIYSGKITSSSIGAGNTNPNVPRGTDKWIIEPINPTTGRPDPTTPTRGTLMGATQPPIPAPLDMERLGVGIPGPAPQVTLPPPPPLAPNRLGVGRPDFGTPEQAPLAASPVPPPIDASRLGVGTPGPAAAPMSFGPPPPMTPSSINFSDYLPSLADRVVGATPEQQVAPDSGPTAPRTTTPSVLPPAELTGNIPPGFGPRTITPTPRTPAEVIANLPTYDPKKPYKTTSGYDAGTPVRTISPYEDMINQAAKQNGVDPLLAHALIKQESKYNPKAKSWAGAQGLMQLMPATAKTLGVKNITDPEQNIKGGMKLLSDLVKKYNGNIPLALVAYNRGDGKANNWIKAGAKLEALPKETQDYINMVMRNYNFYKSEGSKGTR